MPEYITVCEQAARQGGEVLLSWQNRINPREKAPRDLVSEADLASQRAIYQCIHDHYPDHDLLGEEDDFDRSAQRTSEFRWIIDPLDGTTNYVHKLPIFSVSIALEHLGVLVAGAIFDPVADECFSAVRGSGAILNGSPISVSCCESMDNALVATGFGPAVSRDSKDLDSFLDVLVECQALRRLGSAALNLAYLAAGRFDAYWAPSVKIWDVAAGVLLVEEAGGTVGGLKGQPFDLEHPQVAAASTRQLCDALIATLNRGDTTSNQEPYQTDFC